MTDRPRQRQTDRDRGILELIKGKTILSDY